jgi:serine/threonine protein phosphatase PrpC
MEKVDSGVSDLESEWIAADLKVVRAQAVSFVHPQHPQRNEDRVLCDPTLAVAAVFDGMGGEAGGEFAARAACAVFAQELAHLPEDASVSARSHWLRQTICVCADAVARSQRLHARDAPYQGATAVAVALVDAHVLSVAVGDSRAYRYHEGALTCLTPPTAQSPERDLILQRVDELEDESEFEGDFELQLAFRQRNRLDVELGSLKVIPAVNDDGLESGDFVFVCSDGVSDNLTTKEMCEIIKVLVQTTSSPDAIAQALAEAARTRSESGHVRAKPDDITIACLGG